MIVFGCVNIICGPHSQCYLVGQTAAAASAAGGSFGCITNVCDCERIERKVVRTQ